MFVCRRGRVVAMLPPTCRVVGGECPLRTHMQMRQPLPKFDGVAVWDAFLRCVTLCGSAGCPARVCCGFRAVFSAWYGGSPFWKKERGGGGHPPTGVGVLPHPCGFFLLSHTHTHTHTHTHMLE